jgi:hypothetical protein
MLRICEIYEQLTVQYDDNYMSQRKVYEWMERSKEAEEYL